METTKVSRKKIIAGILGLASLGGALAAAPSLAYQGDYSQKGPYYNEERHQKMEQAFENNDYNAWKDLMGDRGRVTQVINEENFSQFAQAHKLADEGNYDEADAIRQELGLRTRSGEAVGAGYGQGFGNGQSRGMAMHRQSK